MDASGLGVMLGQLIASAFNVDLSSEETFDIINGGSVTDVIMDPAAIVA